MVPSDLKLVNDIFRPFHTVKGNAGVLGIASIEQFAHKIETLLDLARSGKHPIGPAEIEDTLLKHPAVALSAVVGIPDQIRTEAVKAWIVLRPGFAPSEQLASEIQDFVKVQLAAHEYPRQVEFADSLPMTATGKVLRRELRARG